MAQSIRDVLTADPITLDVRDTVREAARQMTQHDIGDVLVTEDGEVCGMLTDRDIVVRVVAAGQEPDQVTVGTCCSRDLVSLGPDDSVDDAVRVMRDRAIRRLPILENGEPRGIVSLGDLAIERDRESVLAGISAAPPTH